MFFGFGMPKYLDTERHMQYHFRQKIFDGSLPLRIPDTPEPEFHGCQSPFQELKPDIPISLNTRGSVENRANLFPTQKYNNVIHSCGIFFFNKSFLFIVSRPL